MRSQRKDNTFKPPTLKSDKTRTGKAARLALNIDGFWPGFFVSLLTCSNTRICWLRNFQKPVSGLQLEELHPCIHRSSRINNSIMIVAVPILEDEKNKTPIVKTKRNNAHTKKHLSSTVRLFADDTLPQLKDITIVHNQAALQQDLACLDWEAKWLMSFHPDKCQSLHITRRRNHFTISTAFISSWPSPRVYQRDQVPGTGSHALRRP